MHIYEHRKTPIHCMAILCPIFVPLSPSISLSRSFLDLARSPIIVVNVPFGIMIVVPYCQTDMGRICEEKYIIDWYIARAADNGSETERLFIRLCM